MFKAIAPSSKNNDRLFIPQTNDRISFQPKQRSPIFSDTINVQSDRPFIPKTTIALSFHNPMIATRLKSNNDRLLLSDKLNVQSDRPLTSINQRSHLTSNQIAIAYFRQTY
jgi:CMP-2-keto-3-deoxyoctulosonic acid synthetase